MWDFRAREIIWGFCKFPYHEQGGTTNKEKLCGFLTTTSWDCDFRASKGTKNGREGLHQEQ